MRSEFLGHGWRFPITKEIAQADGEESIRDAIEIILGTAQGERVMRPDFGCGIHDLVFAVNSAGTAGRIASEVRQALIQWEPRIDVLNVRANPAGNGEVLLISIDYRVRTTNNRFNLIYPFYLERGAS